MYDTVIVGGGLAGSCAALFLSLEERVLLLEAAYPAAGASGLGLGLVNPITPRHGRLIWRGEAAVDALDEVLDRADARSLFRPMTILQPAADQKQAGFFERSAQEYPEYTIWISPFEAAERFPGVHSEYGAIATDHGGTIEMPGLVGRLLRTAGKQGAEIVMGVRVEGWTERSDHVDVLGQCGHDPVVFQARRLLLAIGAGYRDFPQTARLHLHSVKGQVVHVTGVSLPLGEDGPILSGSGYVKPSGATLIVGSSYEHSFSSLDPSPEQTRKILKKVSIMYPAILDAEVIGEAAGIRVNVPVVRLPMVGRLPANERVWIFTALGSRGTLLAPLLARSLPNFINGTERIPAEVRVNEC